MVDEMDLIKNLKDAAPMRSSALDEARTTLRVAIAASAQKQGRGSLGILGGRLRRPVWATRGRIGLGATALVAAAAAAVALTVTSSPASQNATASGGGALAEGGTAGSASSTASAVNPVLAQLAAHIVVHEGSLPGNASLEIRNSSASSATPGGNGVDLVTDSGDYYWGPTMAILKQAVASHDVSGAGMFKREMAAALEAVHGDIATARARMEIANYAPGLKAAQAPSGTHSPTPVPGRAKGNDGTLWMNCVSALNAGAGNPQVRAGVLRLLSTVPGVTITNTATGGQSTLTLTETSSALPGTQVFVINAQTGLPVVSMTRQPGGQATGVTDYHISRVSLASFAAGKS